MKYSHYGAASEEAEEISTAERTVRPGEESDGTCLGAQLEEILCPICRRRVFSCSQTVVRLKTRILVFEGESAYAKCKYCRNDVLVPLVMHEAVGEEWLPVWTEGLDGKTR